MSAEISPPTIPLKPQPNANSADWHNFTSAELCAAGAWFQPDRLSASVEQDFALEVQDIVATQLQVHSAKLLPTGRVREQVNAYYRKFDPEATSIPEINRRKAFHKEHVPIAQHAGGQFSEIHVVCGLLMAFGQRQLLYPTRAMFGLLSAMGEVVRELPSPSS